MSEVSIIEKIKTYAKQKVIILSLSLLVSGVAMLISILVINHYAKVRKS